MPKTVIAFDHGAKSIGVAVGQDITGSAQPLAAIKAVDGQPNWDIVAKVLKEWQPDLLVVGLPLNMDGTEQNTTAAAKKFAGRLHGRFGLQVASQDERLTTASAKEWLFENGGYSALEKGKIDSVSACLILESWFENQY
ncbi:Holliday junction resolvase RuvX [Gallaecimonas mangrovi]|uniref:Holliday junction resolvase RuvX n=1 Tax=Gallaecimonas mangrovi TaxID=2291597 RepID=UPI000E208A4F|nr:Holliday junction resolvase RuvX [Gallaecimonas mangrovi]